MSFMNIVSLFGGLGFFLFGMKLMGASLEKAAGSKMRSVLGLLTRNRLLAMLAGIVITVMMQSSSATTVMVVGFVNAGLLSLSQAVGVVMGANVGTTVTSLLLSVKIDFGMIFACIGLIMSSLPEKYSKLKPFGQVTMGLGILFAGMNFMAQAMSPLKDWDVFREAMKTFTNPVLLVLTGAVITMILQSSAASIGILQALSGEGLLPLRSAMFILFGQNIGTCITALLSSAGASTTAKRTACVHLLFNLIGTILFTVLTVLLPMDEWVITLAGDNLRLQIAMTHVLFNVVTTVLLLPTAGLLEQASRLIIRDQSGVGEEMRLKYFDARLLKTPSIAAEQLFLEVQRMGEIALSCFKGSVACFDKWDEDTAKEINRSEDVLDYLNKEITARLVELKSLEISDAETKLVGSLFHVVTDLERVGDHSINLLESAEMKEKEDIRFTSKPTAELDDMSARVLAQLEEALTILRKQETDPDVLNMVEVHEEEIDQLTEQLRNHHVDRVKNRKCSARNGMIYLDMLTNLERIADHAENIATSVHKDLKA